MVTNKKDSVGNCTEENASAYMSLIICERIYKANVGANHLNKYIFCLIQWNLDLRKLYNFNEVFGTTNDFLCTINSKIYEKEPRYNKTSLERTNFATRG